MVDYQTYGLLGEKVSKSISPQIFNALFQELKIPAVYLPFAVPGDKFLTSLPILRSYFFGFTITVPYRIDIMAHLDRLDETARLAGAVNTVKVNGGETVGYNTDMAAFERSLIGFAGNLFDKDVLLIGAGGSAHSVSDVLLEKGACLTIIARNIADAARLQSNLQKRYNKNRIRVAKGLSHSDEFFAVINTAADTESKQSEITIHSHIYQQMKYAYDTSCRNSVFLNKAADFGAKTKNGFDMLFYHAIGALKIWQGENTGLDVTLMTKLYDHIKESMS